MIIRYAPNCGITFIIVIVDTSLSPYDHILVLQYWPYDYIVITIVNYNRETFIV
jgi:hypothetical protein